MRPPDWRCPSPRSSTTPARPTWPATSTTCSTGSRAPACRRSWPRPHRTSRSPSSAWPAASPVAWRPLRTCGTCSPPSATVSARSRTTATGTWPLCTMRIRTTRAPPTPPPAGSCTTFPASTPTSSASPRVRRSRWTRSSGCCWKPRGRRSSARGSPPRTCAAPPPACSSAPTARTTPSCSPARPRASRGTWPPGTPPASSPAGSPTSSAWKVPPSPSTPPARRRWCRCTWRCRRCGRGSVHWPWPAV